MKPSGWWVGQGIALKGPFLGSLTLAPDSLEEMRIQRIRDSMLSMGSKLSIHRAKLLTESWRQNEDAPPIIRKAVAAAHVLRHIPIPLVDEQIFVGSPCAYIGGVELEPEFQALWLLSNVPGKTISQLRYLPHRRYMPVSCSPEDFEELENDILPYWKDRCLAANVLRDFKTLAPSEYRVMERTKVFLPNFGKGYSHTLCDYVSIVDKGLACLVEEMAQHRARHALGNWAVAKLHCYEAMRICAEAVIAYAGRCADICEEAAANAGPERATELRTMAEICRRVPEHPARTWREALQAIHFAHIALFLMDGGVSHAFGRMDSYLAPHYHNWVGGGGVSPDSAQMDLEAFFLKCYEYQSVRDDRSAKGLAGDRTNDKITLGGTDTSGQVISSPLTLRFLEAHVHVHLKEPNLSLRVAQGTSSEVLHAALETLRLGSGLPQLLGDEAVTKALVAKAGMTLEDARLAGDIGCQENCADPNISSADANGHNNAGFFSLPKILELALNRGVNPMTGEQAGPQGIDLLTITNPDVLKQAYLVQLRAVLQAYAAMNTFVEHHYIHTIPSPGISLMHPGPRTCGIPFEAGGCRYNWISSVGVGLATTADSLMVLDKLVLQGDVSWDRMRDCLTRNWLDCSDIHERILSLPRYGGGGREAEDWAAWLASAFAHECGLLVIPRGHSTVRFNVGFFSMGIHMLLGEDVGATPDGRLAGEKISGSLAPSSLAKYLGPTATHMAASRIDTSVTPNGAILNEPLSRTLVANPTDMAKWESLVRAYFTMGGMCVQYSVLDRETLLLARKNPSCYKNVIVRVGGYSARFVDLAEDIQDEFIARAG